MPRGRPAAPKAPTKFLNSKRRVIFMTSNGKYIAKSNKGSTVYNPKARHVKSPGGTVRSLMSSGARVPTAIRPKMTRKLRSNSGKSRGPTANVYGLRGLFRTPVRRGRPPKAGGPKKYVRKEGLRKVRSNKGVSRKQKAMFARLMPALN